MKICIYLLLPMIMLFACKSPVSESKNEELFPYAIVQDKLDNGLTTATVEYPSPGIVAFYIIVRAGSREEVEPGKTGFAHFFEHMMFRGTEKYPPEAYNAELKNIGAAANANTSIDRTIYHMTGSASALEKMFELEADRFMNLSYPVHAFKTEAGAVKGEYTKNYANPFRRLNEATMAAAFDQHTYKHTTMGFWEDIVDMPNQYEYSLTFFDRFYRPEYTTILAVGDVKPDQVKRLAEQYFGNWQKGSYAPSIPIEPPQTETRYAHVQEPGFPPYLELNYKGPAFDESSIENAALDIILTILFSERSDLYKKLVIDEGILRNLGSDAHFARDPYLLSIFASFKDEKDMEKVKDEIVQTLDEIKTKPVDSQLLEDAKSHIRNSMIMRMDNPSSIADNLSYFIWVSGNANAFNALMKKFEEVTPEDILAVANKYFIPEKLTISTISPNKEGGIQ